MRSKTPLFLACLLFSCPLIAQDAKPNLVLQGEVHASQNHTYFEVPFRVPPGTHRISVTFHNLGHDQHTVLDLGIEDPVRFRGASGGNKDHFTVSETDATPSYLPGAIPPGMWKLLIAVPNIRPGVTSRYRAEVWFNSRIEDSSFTNQPLKTQPGWYRGDLHMHNAHSDGSCPSETGKAVPCPLFLTVEAAARRALDFIAITDHNTTSQYDDERELQPYFDKLLLIPGRELTTFHGHANEFGTTQWIDYRVGTRQVPGVNAMFRSARALGAVVSINHPESPTGEICMGCGWDPTPAADMRLVTSVEVVNGGGVPATRFWEDQLRQGFRLTAIGGSDNHHADWPPNRPASIGYPTTIVYAQDLSVPAILDGIRSGRVFIDVTGSRDRLLDMRAESGGGSSAEMGGSLHAAKGASVALHVHVKACQDCTVEFFVDGKAAAALQALPVPAPDATVDTKWSSDGARHWLRAEVHGSDHRLLLLGNPVYINWTVQEGQ
ncbi:MAG TPA: CehA/McbA family metallohydrolase [Acidobacteriaceae bacterium]|nr:CehA/McbA family metallohydrolase [Acidobacteriaceae bacterium]